MNISTCLYVLSLAALANSARILGLFPMASVSHQIVFQPIWKELSLRGHQVTVVTPNPLKDPNLVNLTEIDVSFLYAVVNSTTSRFSREIDHWDVLRIYPKLVMKLSEGMLEDPRVRKLADNNTKSFDLVLTHLQFPVMASFAYRYKCPFVGISSMGIMAFTHEAVGNPAHPVLNPDVFLTYDDDMSFLQRVESVLHGLLLRYFYYNVDLPQFDALARKYIGEDMPYLGELEKNVSILLLNTNPVIHLPRAYNPRVKELGRMHFRPAAKLPQNLQSFLNNSKNGVIYFSLGSNIKSVHMQPEKKQAILKAFKELPYEVIWKYEDDSMTDTPKNVRISKWLPQQDLLRHPNIRLFITQAGLQSIEEAIASEVPLLALPFMVDQHFNAKRIQKLGIGLSLKFSTLSKDEFKNAILEVIEDPRYKKNIARVNEILKDRPMSGLETAVWWIEYVLRHQGTQHFRSRVADVAWYEYFLIDVFTFLVCVLVVVMFVLCKFVRFVISKLISSSREKIKVI